jgi:hypothetical protein
MLQVSILTVECDRGSSQKIPFLLLSLLFIVVEIDIPLPEAVSQLSLAQRLQRIDYLGAVTLIVSITTLLLPIGLKSTEDVTWTHPLIWSLFLVSILSGSLFFIAEARWSRYPILPTRLITERTPLFVALTNLCVSVGSALCTLMDISFTTYAGFSMLYNVPLVGNKFTIIYALGISHILLKQYFSAVRLSSAKEAGSHLLPNSVNSIHFTSSVDSKLVVQDRFECRKSICRMVG